MVLTDWSAADCVFLFWAAVVALSGGWTDAGDRATPLAAEGGAHRWRWEGLSPVSAHPPEYNPVLTLLQDTALTGLLV